MRIAAAVFLAVGIVSCFAIFMYSLLFYRVFTPGDETLAVFAAEKSKGFFSGFFCAGLNILAISYFQSTQAPGKALLLSSLRGFLLPGIFILTIPFIAGQSYLWICHSIAEVCTLLVCLLLYFRKVRT